MPFPKRARSSTRSTTHSARSCRRSSGKARRTSLTLTANAQPALMAVSLAAIRALEARGFALKDKVAYVAGHSLGEYSALAAAGTFSVADTARLLRIRGNAMQQAVPVGEGAMAAIIGLDQADVEAACAEAAETARSARSPTTMAAASSSFPAPRPPSSRPRSSAPKKAPSARSCCRCPRRSIRR